MMPAARFPPRTAIACLLVTALAATPAAGRDDPVAAGDAAWQRRADAAGGADREQIEQSIAAYERALAADPADLEARWKLMRALFFLGEHVLDDRDERLGVFERGRELGDEGVDQIAAAAGLDREALIELDAPALRAAVAEPVVGAEILFWSAVHWGLWGRTRGKLAAAREGAAGRVRDLATASIHLAPEIQNGGGHRILGRLHTEAPSIPFVTGWIDRDTAVRELERAHQLAPDDLTTRLYLAEALVEFDRDRRQEGIAMLESVVAADPDPEWRVEELAAIADARRLLATLDR